ncbi:MAG: TetR/AcrR family transcriptional regulator [Pseudomonadota bacterium]
MARTKGSTAETTKPRIRQAAGRLMAELGYDAVTMRGIGAEIGLRAGAIYRYFPDKANLATDLLAEALSERDKALQHVDRSAGPLQTLESFAGSYLNWRMAPGGAANMIKLCLPALGAQGEALQAASLAPETEVEAILASGQEAGLFTLPDTQIAARTVIAVLDEVASDTRLPEDRRRRIGWSLVRRLVKA